MSFAARLRNTYLRIDARSLGLFRVAMGLALIGDWWARWADARAFYSNDGVLANHAHLHSLFKQEGPSRVWSVFHAFSSPGENRVALLLTLLVYLFFLFGLHTRVFHVLSLVLLVSLTGRNILLEGPQNHVALVVLAATAFLPLGSRFSVDSLRASFRRHDEKGAAALNDRAPAEPAALVAERPAGWSPTSLAALAVLLQLTIVLVAVWRQQSGPTWQDGTALHYSLWVERWVSGLGVLVRSAPPVVLSAWTRVLRFTPIVVPALLFVPLGRITRPLATALLLVYGLTYGLLFSFGLWGWTFVALAFLVISTETWDAYQGRFARGRALTVIYDADCGICLWITRLLKRLDLRGHLTFQGNDLLTTPPDAAPGERPPYRTPGDGDAPPRLLYRRAASPAGNRSLAPVEAAPLPAAVTDELVTGTVVAVGERGEVLTEGRALAAIVRSLPFGAVLSLPLRIPGTAGLWNALYRTVPPRRYAISEALGMGACGVPAAGGGAASDDGSLPSEIPPSVRLRRLLTGTLREAGALLLLAAALAQTAKQNPWPVALTIPQYRTFAAITGWTRIGARYDLLAPDPPTKDGVMVVDAQTRAGQSVDPLTGQEPRFDSTRFRMGPLWSTYLSHIRRKDRPDLEKPFRDYLVKGGPAWSTDLSDNQITGLDAYWLVYQSPAPGGQSARILGREKIFSHARGGRGKTDVPVLEPTSNR